MSVFVINLASRRDRLEKFMKNEIPRLEIFNAIQNKVHPKYGCTQSHKSIIEISKLRKDEYCFIFEDDAVLDVQFCKMENAVKKLNETTNWEILLFSASQFFDNGKYIKLNSDYEFIMNDGEFNGAYSMAIHSRAYDKLIKGMHESKVSDDVDIDIYSILCKDHIYLTLPYMCYVLPNDQSDIRKVDTSDDLENIKLGETRLLLKNSFLSREFNME